MCGDGAADDQLAQKIADLCTSTYEGIKNKAAKPTIRLNGVAEWTILAGLVAIEGEKLTLITLATGMKTMPNEIREYSSGLIVHDLHAEILCLRMFNWWLMQEARQLHEIIGDNEEGKKRKNSFHLGAENQKKKVSRVLEPSSHEGSVLNGASIIDKEVKTSNADSGQKIHDLVDEAKTEASGEVDIVGNTNIPDEVIPGVEHNKFSLLARNREGNKFILRPGIKLALYISEPPCGDASMSSMGGGEPWKDKKDQILRGRANFNTVGVVRTKPGRADSKVSYSKSCSDKLCLKQFTGILNAINSLCIEPIYLLYLVVPRKRSVTNDFNRCFRERIGAKAKESLTHPLEFLFYQEDSFSFRKQDDKSSPLPLSFVYCDLDKTGQVLQNGVKNGAYVKNRAPAMKGASILSRRSLWHQATNVIGDFEDYTSIKAINSSRMDLKKRIRSHLGLWPESSAESFQLK